MEKNYGVQILIARYFSLKEKATTASEEMISNPNEYSANAYNQSASLMGEILQCLDAIGVKEISLP